MGWPDFFRSPHHVLQGNFIKDMCMKYHDGNEYPDDEYHTAIPAEFLLECLVKFLSPESLYRQPRAVAAVALTECDKGIA